MSFSIGDLLPYQSIPYHLAAPTLQAEAMRIIQNVFQQDFPTLTPSQWLQVIATCYPVLEVAGSDIELREEDLIRLATYLRVKYVDANSPLRLAYCHSAHHVAHKLNGISRRADWVLTQGATLPASEQQELIELYRSALESISSGDAIASNISLAFAFRDPNRLPPRRVYAQPCATEMADSTAATPSPARTKHRIHELPEQWEHLQAWFKQNNDPAKPWCVSEIARQLKLNQPMVRALLVAPKGAPGCSRTAFTKSRLRRLQRYFQTYGYLPL